MRSFLQNALVPSTPILLLPTIELHVRWPIYIINSVDKTKLKIFIVCLHYEISFFGIFLWCLCYSVSQTL